MQGVQHATRYFYNRQCKVCLICKCKETDNLPPTSDTLRFHIQRAHYQTKIWNQASIPEMTIENPCLYGWYEVDETLKPTLSSLPPIPDSCDELLSCQCNTGCRTLRCRCRKSKLLCTQLCKCRKPGHAVPCVNIAD